MKFALLLLSTAVSLCPLAAQPVARAIVLDGDGPWRDGRWTFAVTEFTRLLQDAGYSVTTVSPIDLPSKRPARETLLAVPSLESLPYETFAAVAAHVAGGGTLMATGGEPFRVPLYLSPSGKWLDSAAYQSETGSPAPAEGPFFPPVIETLSPAYKQYTNSLGLRVPIARWRGLSSTPNPAGRYRAIGDLLAPAATLYLPGDYGYSPGTGALVVWLPWPQLSDPLRAQLVAALHAADRRLHLICAGPNQIVWLPGEDAAGRAQILNAGASAVQAVLQWSLSGPNGEVAQSPIPVSLGPGEPKPVPVDFGQLPAGDYTAAFRLMLDGEEVDRIDAPIRIFDPTLTRQPDQKIRVDGSSFSAGGRHVFLSGVNYWPRYIPGIEPVSFNGQSWLQPEQYDPDLIEADLSEIEALHFNLVNIVYGDLQFDWVRQGRSLMDFLERCRHHGIWVRIALRATVTSQALTGELNQQVGSYITSAALPGNDRVFAYELIWEPFVGLHDHGGQDGFVNGHPVYNTGRLIIDPDWRVWVDDQYGSLAAAEQAWGFAAPRDDKGQLTNPLDDQIANDGPWRIMVAAYRRFLEDYFGRNLGLIAREIRRTDPDTPLTYRNWTTMTADHNLNTGYDIGTAAAHLDFFSPERYGVQLPWPGDRGYGLVVAYSRYRTGNKPVQWTEFGYDVGADGGTAASRAAQALICDTMMRQVADDGSNAATVWWWPGGVQPVTGGDFGIVDPDGTPRGCAVTLAQWSQTFTASPPDLHSDPRITLNVDRDADARGSYGLFLKWQARYVEARQAGQAVVLSDEGAGTNSATMPLVQVGNAAYSGSGPLKFANAEIGGIRVVCPGLDVAVENGSQVKIPAGVSCQISPTLVNTGEAQWLPGAGAKGGVTLHTSVGDAPLSAPLPALQRVTMGPLSVTMGQNAIA
ncbi:MAG TPA: hypothetical protein VGF59_10780, partial [Bryobacteraceae bacterium]